MSTIQVESNVWVPRSNGTETKGTVRQILPKCPSVGEMFDQAYVTWTVQVPSNVAYPVAHAMSENPCVRMVTMVQAKWVPVEKLRLVDV